MEKNKSLLAAALKVLMGETEEKKMEELNEQENIQELSKKTLGSYIKKANTDSVNLQQDKTLDTLDHSNANNLKMKDYYKKKINNANKKINNRKNGISMATNKLVKENDTKEYGVDGERERAAKGERYDKTGKIVNKIRSRKNTGKTDTGKTKDEVVVKE